MCSIIGTPNDHHFQFGTNGKVVMLGVPILKHFRVCPTVNGLTVRGNNSAIFIFVSLLNGNQLLKKRVNSIRNKIFPLRLDPFLKGLLSKEADRKSHKKAVPLCKNCEKKT